MYPKSISSTTRRRLGSGSKHFSLPRDLFLWCLRSFRCIGSQLLEQPAQEVQDLARFLIIQCGDDIDYGHSSHHVLAAEKYNSKLIFHGCGDSVDDYALVREFRNDLSGIWRVIVVEKDEAEGCPCKSLESF